MTAFSGWLGMVLWALLAFASLADAAAVSKIKILATGGTIGGAQLDSSRPYYKPGAVAVGDLIKALPQLQALADVSGEQLASIDSSTMSHAIWVKLANRINALLAGDGADGIVVTHGTNTLEETAYFLSLVVASDKPVVLVGAMRPATAIGADGPANLYNAVAVAADPEARGRGPLVLINDEIHYAHEVIKTNTTQLDTFKSPNRGRAGVMERGKARFYSANTVRHTTRSEFSLTGLSADALPRVDIVYSHVDYRPDVIEYLVRSGSQGIVLAGVGDGGTTDAARDALHEAVLKGVAVVRSSHTGSGIVERTLDVNDPFSDEKLGFIAAGELSPQKARILLMLALTRTHDSGVLQRYFDEY